MNPAPLHDGPPPSPVPDFKDRRTGLLVFGILDILLGVLCVLLVGLMVLGQAMVSRTAATALSTRMLLPGMLFYLALAAAFVWLGIGSIRCRRWARALALILAWSWLCVGVISVPVTGFVLPRALADASATGQTLPRGLLTVVLVFQLVLMTLLLVVLPAVLVCFYQSRHVKATCQACDPTPRWTDACPLPVLAVACWLWLGSVMILSLPLVCGGVLPLFGAIVSGWPGTLLDGVLAVLWFWLGRLWYQLKPAGWWLFVAALVVLSLSNLMTFSHVDLMELYRKMGYPEAQLDLIRRQGWLSNRFLVWISVASLVPMLGYLLWVKGFFLPGPHHGEHHVGGAAA